jgi:nucleoside-diphosphate-sugar epimerase
MHIFITGATGFVGTAIVQNLVAAGHRVTGLARSDESAAALAAAGAQAQRGSLSDLESLTAGASAADGVIHAGFNHDFSKFAENCEEDRLAIETLGAALEGSDRPLLVTSGLARIAPGRPVTEADPPAAHKPEFPRVSEIAALALAARGVRASAVRLPPSTHGAGDHGFVPILIGIARQTGVSAYVDEGTNRWASTHRRDAAKVFRLALERGATDGPYHAVAEEGIAFKDIAAVIGEQLGLPVVSRPAEHFGWFGMFAGADMAGTSVRTRALLGWEPAEAGLLADMAANYFAA